MSRTLLLAALALCYAGYCGARGGECLWLRAGQEQAPIAPAGVMRFRGAGIQGFKPHTAPEWVKQGVIYEVNTPAFSASGDLAGVTAQLDRLKALGVAALWLMPINPPGSRRAFGSVYCVRDYYAVNPRYGGEKELRRLISQAHRRGIRVILDVVLNHTSWDNDLITQHPEWYRHRDGDPHNPASIVSPNGWNDVAQLDYADHDLRSYMVKMLQHWVLAYGVDGFRCDSAEYLPTDFWNQARDKLDAVQPGVLMLAEGQRPELMVHAFDLDYSYALYNALTEILVRHKPALILPRALDAERQVFPPAACHLRYIDNHDQQRAVIRFGADAARAASVLAFMIDGVPMLYNGMEIGDASTEGFINPRPLRWEVGDKSWTRLYVLLTELRRRHRALRAGALHWVGNSEPSRLITFTRTDADEELLAAVNLSGEAVDADLDLAHASGWADVRPLLIIASRRTPKRPLLSGARLSLAPYGCTELRRPLH